MVVTFDSTISHTLEDMKRREDWSFSFELKFASSGDGLRRFDCFSSDGAGVTGGFLLLIDDDDDIVWFLYELSGLRLERLRCSLKLRLV